MSLDKRARRSWKTTIIEPFKQLRLGLYVMGVSIIFVVVCAGLFVLAFYQQYQNVMDIFGVADPNVKWEIVVDDVFRKNAWRVAVAFLVYLVTLCWLVFVMTHKVYGPLVSIERFIDHIQKGEYHKRARIREGDDLERLVTKLNAMAEKLEERHGRKKH